MKTVYTGKMDPRSFKDVLGATIAGLLDHDPDVIYLDADLMRCIGTYGYFKKHPDRAINCGIAEANMAGVAAGLSAAGFKPIAHSFGTFASRRCFDQVYLSAGYGKNPITMIGSDPGVCAAFNGGTHMPFEDMAMYRALPGATVVDVTDTAQLENIFPQLVKREGVKYLRVNRKSNDLVYEAGSEFEIGKGVVLREGKDATIVACGFMVGRALKAAEELEKKGISAAVIDMFTVKPLDEEIVIRAAKECGKVITAEEHSVIGGLGEAVCAVLSEKCPTPVRRVGVQDKFGCSGPAWDLLKLYGLDAATICKTAHEML